jgi:hypothetical protein
MTKKPAKLSTIFNEPPQPAPADTAPKQRPDVKQQTLYLPLPVYRQLRQLAFDEEVKMHSLVMEGLDRVFADRGLPSAAELTRES